GKMYAAGWHQSMEAGKGLTFYAPKLGISPESICRFQACIDRFPMVAQLYAHGLCTLFPAGGKAVVDYAIDKSIPSFADTNLDGPSAAFPFANSLTITRDDFSNYQHRDRDEIQIAYGLWWPAAYVQTPKDGKYTYYQLHKDGDHSDIKGGAFLWGEYGVGVDFQRCSGLVEIYWRGKVDFHSTMASHSPRGVTRFGTSVQLTRKGTAAVARHWKNGGLRKRIVTANDRLAKIQRIENHGHQPKGKGKAH
ncbi:hypothetical protein BD779DRAFT_1458818, partial [Infundibulicybe gibba]